MKNTRILRKLANIKIMRRKWRRRRKEEEQWWR
jgi:hypothetical protein